ncbi:MAG: Flp pilus assembly complex ATPase component TadA [Acidimicrobiales bacterium]|nr:Flp pilus assembly complex ATPase component TadA [Acidimicrobiales bacterium]
MTTTNEQEEQFPADGRRTPLGAHLIAAGLATGVQVERALEEQRQTGKRLGEILIGHGVLYEADLASALATMFDLPYRDLSLDPPDPAALNQIPQAFCWSRGVLPLGFEDNAVVVGVADPRDIQTVDDLTMMTSAPVRMVVVAPGQLRQAIEQSYQTMDLVVESEDPSAGKTDVSRSSDGPSIGDVPNVDVSPDVDLSLGEGPVITFVNQLLRRAVDERASDLHLEPTREGLRVRFRVDGILHDVWDAPPSRLLQKDEGLLDIARLGFMPDALNLYRESFQRAWGMVLATGPTGSGKTTTLYATVNELNVPTRNTITVEDPIEYRVAGIKQTQVNSKVGYTFASGLRAALRSDPDIILIGEIRDLETARIAAESALTGHLVLSTLHANDASSSTTRLIDMGLEPYLVTSSLECVVAQRLLRRLCDRCKIVEPASTAELLELTTMSLLDESTSDLSLYRANGCAQCGQRGYRGRLAVHEVLVMNDELKTLVLGRAPAHAIAQAATAGGMQTLLQDAFAKVRLGETSLDECKRVLR